MLGSRGKTLKQWMHLIAGQSTLLASTFAPLFNPKALTQLRNAVVARQSLQRFSNIIVHGWCRVTNTAFFVRSGSDHPATTVVETGSAALALWCRESHQRSQRTILLHMPSRPSPPKSPNNLSPNPSMQTCNAVPGAVLALGENAFAASLSVCLLCAS